MAANLDEAAAHALEMANGLLAAGETARTQLVEMRERIAQVSERIDADWSAVRERARAFLEQVISEDQQLLAATVEANQALDELKSVFRRLEDEAPSEIASTQEEFDELAEVVGAVEPELEAALDEAKSVTESFEDKVHDIESRLDDDFDQAERELADILHREIKDLEAEAEQETIELNAYFAGQCLPAILAKTQELYEQLVQAQEEVRVALTSAGDEVETITDQTLRDTAGYYDEELEDLDDLSRSVERTLGELRDFIGSGMDRIKDRNSRWDDSIRTTQRGLKEAHQALKELEDYFRHFAFMR